MEESVGCPIIEETPPSTIGDMVPVVACPNTDLFPSVIFESSTPPLRSLLVDQLQLIFDLRRDVLEQLFIQDILDHHLDAFFNPFSREPVKRRCPICSHPYAFAPAWPRPPNGNDNKDTSNI